MKINKLLLPNYSYLKGYHHLSRNKYNNIRTIFNLLDMHIYFIEIRIRQNICLNI